MANGTETRTRRSFVSDWPPVVWYRLILASSIVLSVGGFWYGANNDPTSDGGRGGALAVALAFFSLFTRTKLALKVFKTISVENPAMYREMNEIVTKMEGKGPTPESHPMDQDLRDEVEGILGMIDMKDKEQRVQNGYIAAASIVGTLSWGFGDKLAQYWQCHIGI